MAWLRAPRAWWLVLLASLACVGLALVSQHVYDMQPCPWCVLQRVIFLGMAVFAAIGLVWRSVVGQLLAGLGAEALATAGAVAALWQHFVAAANTSCNLTLADKILTGLTLDTLAPELFEPRANCAEAKADLLGVSYEFWSLALFLLLGAVALGAALAPLRKRLSPAG